MRRIFTSLLLALVVLSSRALAQDDPCAGHDREQCVEDAGALVSDDATIAQAIAIYRYGCNHSSAAACRHLGVLYATGHGVAAEMMRAIAMFESSCTGGDQRGCFELARALTSSEGPRPKAPCP